MSESRQHTREREQVGGEERTYALGAEVERAAVIERLRSTFRTWEPGSSSARETCYDSFDWRLWRRGLVLLERERAGTRQLILRSGADPRPRVVPSLKRPAFATDLPDLLRELLEPVLEMRRLLPLVDLGRRTQALDVIDREEKTVARVRIEDVEAGSPGGGATHALGTVLRASPVRGYPKAHRKLCSLLEEEVGLRVLAESELQRALAATGREDVGRRYKLDVSLARGASAGAAVVRIHQALISILQANEEGTRRNLDSEFLHDFRVSVRRLRTALGQLKGVFPAELEEHYRAGFGWLAGVTGPARDLDVFILKLPEYEASLPEDVRADLAPLVELLHRRQPVEYDQLVSELDRPRYREVVEGWSDLNARPAEDAVLPEAAATPALELASRRIWRAYKRITKHGRAIEPSTPVEALHRLRIDAKKLRYLLEFFRSLYPKSDIGEAIAALKRLQTNLGDLNDCEVQQGALAELGAELAEANSGRTVLAMGRLSEQLEVRKLAERRAFAQLFESFDDTENRKRYRRLFAPEGRKDS